MTYTITQNCISCQRCLSGCPTQAIQTDGSTFWINVNLCNQCQDTHGVPQCWAICPTNEGCVPLSAGTMAVSVTARDNALTDYWQIWFTTYTRMMERLKDSQQSGYWHQWFDSYSQILKNLQTHENNSINLPLMP